MISIPPTPQVAINAVLDRAKLPHIRQLSCKHDECRGVVNGHRTTWRITTQGRAQLICICYLTRPPKPTPRP